LTRYLKLNQILKIHQAIIKKSGGLSGVRDLGALKSALAQPHQGFAGKKRFTTLEEKAAAYGFFITRNHPFVDGNKRVGHACMESFLLLNGREIKADVDDQEQLMLKLAAGKLSLEELIEWLKSHTTPSA
jgi:death-on-curing protein